MKPIEPGSLSAQTLPRPPAKTAGGALQAAETVVAPAGRKKAAARADSAIAPDASVHGRAMPADDAIASPPDREASAGLLGAVAFDAPCEAREIGAPERNTDTAASPLIPGIGDRLHHLAMVAASGTPSLRPPALAKKSGIAKLTPKSRTECEQGCGCNGCCDPSGEPGCGGIFCRRKHDGV